MDPLIDYLLRFDDEALARKTCPDLLVAGGDEWHPSFVIPNVKVFARDADAKDEAPGWYLWLATQGRQPNIEAEAWCLMGTERDSRKVVHARLPIETLSALHIEPVYCGTTYRFGEAKQLGTDVELAAIKADARALTFTKKQIGVVKDAEVLETDILRDP